MRYINLVTEEYPYSVEKLRAAFPNVSFPKKPDAELLLSYGVAPVVEVKPPAYDKTTQQPNELAPSLVDGVWTQQWEIVELSPEAAILVRETITQEISNGVQRRLDEFARTRNYDGILSACSYTNSGVKRFKDEASRAVALRDATWSKCYEILAKVEGGQRTPPTSYEDIEAELPPLTWE